MTTSPTGAGWDTPGADTPGAAQVPPAAPPPHRDHRPGPPEDASIGDLLGNITEDFSTLVRQEMNLAKAELTETVTKVGRGAGMFGGAGLAGAFTLLFLSLALWWAIGAMIGQGDAQPALGWSALIVAAVWAVIAAVLALIGRKDVKEAEGLPQTAATAKRIPGALKGQE